MTQANDTLVVERWPIDKVHPNPKNPRTHSEDQLKQIGASMDEFGFYRPLLVKPDGELIAGEAVWTVAKRRKLEDVPVIVIRHLTEQQLDALIVADNQLGVRSGWDMDKLRSIVGNLNLGGFRMDALGFGPMDLEKLLAPTGTAGLTDPDAVGDLPTEPVTQPGDVWVLGRHRLACGDSTDADLVGKALGQVKPGLMVTDPPYGVDYDPDWRLDRGVNKPTQQIASGKVENDKRTDWRDAYALFPGDIAYVWHPALHAGAFEAALIAAGFVVRAQIIWRKSSIVIGRGHYHWQHEPCHYAVRKGKTGNWNGDRKQSTVWDIPTTHRTQGDADDGRTSHSTQKPVECMKRPIENNSSPGQAVYEPFSGSGTTIIACEMTGRCCIAIELKPAYVDLAIERWQKFTGQSAVLESSGETFDAMKAKRSAPPASETKAAPKASKKGGGRKR
jgi:DNA modification methylase